MNGRLFWKILGAFWLTLTVAGLCVVVTFMLLTHPRAGSRGLFDQIRTERLQAATVALHHGGRPALTELTSVWSPEDRASLKVVRGADGELKPYIPPPSGPSPWSLWPLGVQIAAGLIFSAALAGYLAQPIASLRKGFRELAEGDLGVRLTPGMGRRRDEIADLARDFDAMAERLQQLVASRDRLLHDVSHELRSPLARLSVAVSLARRREGRDDQALTRIETEGARLDAIVGDLLSLSRAESDAAAEQSYFDLASLLEVVCEDARFEAQPMGVKVALTLGAELADPERAPVLAGAPELLRRAVENVIRNAMRFSPAGKTVEVAAGVAAGQIVIEVADEGPGAPEAMLRSMFDPFVKGVGEARGVGLGLAIARRALAAHGGEITAFNREGAGLLMRLTLPVRKAAPDRAEAGLSAGH